MEDYGVAVVVHPSQHSIVVMAFPANLCNAFFLRPVRDPSTETATSFWSQNINIPGIKSALDFNNLQRASW